ncbi:hypothetical protein N9W41_01580 [bacterium]|nr:hypothetical protein [bacterium]
MKLLFVLLILFSIDSYGQRIQVQEGFFDSDAAEELSEEDSPENDEVEVENSESLDEELADTEPEAPAEEEIEQADQITKEIPHKRNNTPKNQLDKYESRSLSHGKKQIKHPHAKKGLYLITKQREYIYKVKKTKQSKAMTVQIGGYDPTFLNNGTNNFSDFYDSGFLINVDYEWQVYKGMLGVLGLKAASGLFLANGNGRLASDNSTSKEAFTFMMLPNSVSAVYRMKYWDKQPIIPYAEGGVGYYTFLEARDDKKGPWPGRIGGSATAHWAAGGALDLSFLNKDSILNLDREYGINGIFLTVEYRQLIGLSGTFDFSGSVVNAGILAEF